MVAKGKYGKYVNPMGWLDDSRLPKGITAKELYKDYPGKFAWPALLFDREVCKESTMWVEILHGYKSGGIAARIGHVHPDFDELFLFIGTNPKDTGHLGGEVEFWLGEGDQGEKFVFDTATAVHCPPGLAHGPGIFRRVDNPEQPILSITIARTPVYPANVELEYNKLPKDVITKVPTKFSLEGLL